MCALNCIDVIRCRQMHLTFSAVNKNEWIVVGNDGLDRGYRSIAKYSKVKSFRILSNLHYFKWIPSCVEGKWRKRQSESKFERITNQKAKNG